MIVEKKQLEAAEVGGHITLDKLAIPGTVKVEYPATLVQNPIIPQSFDCYGHPNFTKEQTNLYYFKQETLKRQKFSNFIPLELEVTYEEEIFDVPRSTFDTVKGVDRSLISLSAFNEMLKNRKRFLKANEGTKLNEFIVFGRYWLDQFGQINAVMAESVEKASIKDDVEDFGSFKVRNHNLRYSFSRAIPPEDSSCPCCGKKYTIDDVKDYYCRYVDGKFYHEKCWRSYRRLMEIDKFTRGMMSNIYKDTDYSFELLPNDYCHEDCCSHIPWFLFHTIDGDIIMGWRKRVISIEWQENYKPFDMKKLFGKENVTKWEEDGKRGIHAWGEAKAYEYLEKVLEIVNPGYFSF